MEEVEPVREQKPSKAAVSHNLGQDTLMDEMGFNFQASPSAPGV